MTRNKRITAIILAVCIAVASAVIAPIPASAAADMSVPAGGQSGYYTYYLDGEYVDGILMNGYAVLTGYLGSESALSIPSRLDGYLVAAIDNNAFKGKAFLTDVTVPDGVVLIGAAAFCDCPALKAVTLPKSVTGIGSYALGYVYDRGYKKVEGFTVRGRKDSAAQTYAQTHGFDFEDVTAADYTYTVSDSKATITGYTGTDSALEIPCELGGCPVTAIGDNAFYNNQKLTSVVIPSGVTSIGANAFYWCRSMNSVTVPEGVLTIGSGAFYACPALTSVRIPDTVTRIEADAFGACGGLTQLTIGKSVETIGAAAFSHCEKLTSVTVPDSVTLIGDSAFERCQGLTSVSLGGGLRTIGDGAFWLCKNLAAVEIPESVETIGVDAFCGCSKILSVTIPYGVKSVGAHALGYYYEDAYKKVNGFSVSGYRGTAADEYAAANGFGFTALGDLLGDVDSDGSVTILDATAIQRKLASLHNDVFIAAASDADGSGELEITDATEIQRFLADLPSNPMIGKPAD